MRSEVDVLLGEGSGGLFEDGDSLGVGSEEMSLDGFHVALLTSWRW